MKNYQVRDVDEFIANSPEKTRPKLTELRKVIKSTIPAAEEGISWGVPFYKYKGFWLGLCHLKTTSTLDW